jgi:hypothetical protein
MEMSTKGLRFLEMTQRQTVNFSVVLRQQGRGPYLLPPLKGAVIKEDRTGDIRFLRVPE